MKKVILFGLFGLLLLGATVTEVLADVSVNVPATFTLKVNESATVANYQSMKIEILPPTLGSASMAKYVLVKFSSPGGCGPGADPRCLGAPGFQNTYTFHEGESQTVLTLKVRVSNISDGDDGATFQISYSTIIDPPPIIRCIPRPPCIDAIPRCMMLEPAEGWCQNSSPGPQEDAVPTSTMPVFNLSKGESIVSTQKIEATSDVSAHYEVKTEERKWLFFIIPLKAEITYSVDAQTGASVVIDRPWWIFLAW